MELTCKIVGIRQLGDQKAVDLLWRADDGSILRDDGATEIPDQVNVDLDARDSVIRDAIHVKRLALMEALEQPGVGITIAPQEMTVNIDLIGQEL